VASGTLHEVFILDMEIFAIRECIASSGWQTLVGLEIFGMT
jgi:hypothetical protein